jgi:uncharacterized membrane protein
MHTLQEKISLLVSLTNALGVLFNIFLFFITTTAL